MTTTTRRAFQRDPVDLDPCGVPIAQVSPGVAARRRTAPLPGLVPHAVLAMVQRVDPPRASQPLVWGCAQGRTVLFQVDDATCRDLQAALDAGEEPSAIIEPDQIVALDI